MAHYECEYESKTNQTKPNVEASSMLQAEKWGVAIGEKRGAVFPNNNVRTRDRRVERTRSAILD